MFGTLYWNSHNKDAKFVEKLDELSNSKKYLSCDRCRARKVMSRESTLIDSMKIRACIDGVGATC